MIAGANGGGIGAWLVGVTFLLTTLLMGGGALAMSAVQRKIMSRVGAELEEALPPRDDGLRETGAPGRAVVLGLTDTGMSINDHPVVRLRLRVSPDDGSAPFEAELSQRVSRIAVPRAGDLCPIRYDQEDHTRVVTTEQFSAPTASKAEDQFGSP
jgi:hypothetical protein